MLCPDFANEIRYGWRSLREGPAVGKDQQATDRPALLVVLKQFVFRIQRPVRVSRIDSHQRTRRQRAVRGFELRRLLCIRRPIGDGKCDIHVIRKLRERQIR